MSNTTVRKISTVLSLDGEQKFNSELKSVNRNMSAMRSELKLVSAEYSNNANSLEALRKKQSALSDLNAQSEEKVRALEAAYKKAVETWHEGSKQADDYRAKLNSAKAEQIKYKKELEDTNQYLQEAEKSTDGCATSIDNYGNKVKDTSKKVKKLGEYAEDSGEKSSKAFSAMASALAAAGVAKGVSEIKDMLIDCANASADFESSFAKVVSIAGVENADKLKEQVLKISSAYGINANDVSQSIYDSISAGVSAENAGAFTETATKLAIGGLSETATAVDVLTTIINAYNMKADDAARISDILITTQNLGKTTVDELGSSMGKVIPLAAAYGVTIDDLATAYSIMTAGGIKTAETTTYLKAMINELGDSSKGVGEIIKEKTGKSLAELTETGTSLNDVMQILSKSVNGNKTEFANLWSSSEAGVGALALLNAGTEKYSKVSKEMAESTGAAASAYGIMADTATTTTNKLQVAADNLKVAIGDELAPALNDLKRGLANALEKATEYVKNNPQIVSAVTGLAAALGTLTTGLLTAKAAMAAISLIAPAMGTAIGAASGPIGLVIAALSLLVGNLVASSVETSKYTEEMNDCKDAANTLNDSIADFNDSIEQTSNVTSSTTSLVDAYIGKLDQMNSQTFLSTNQKQRYIEIVDQLNAIIPTLNLTIDENTGKLEQNTNWIRRNTEAWAKQQIYESAKEQFKAITQEYIAADAALTEARNSQEEAAVRQKEAQEAYNNKLEEAKAYIDQLKESGAQYVNEAGIIYQYTGDTARALEYANEEMKGWNGTVDDCITAVRDAEKSMDEMQLKIETLGDTASRYANAAGHHIIDGLNSGIDEGAELFYAKMESLAKGGQRRFNQINYIASPSKWYKRAAGYIVEGLTKGIDDGVPNVETSFANLAKSAQDAYSNESSIGFSVPEMQRSSAASNRNYTTLIEEIKKLGNIKIYLDGETLVGGTMGRIDNKMAESIKFGLRGDA